MLSSQASVALVDIRFNIILVSDFLRGFDFDRFESDLKTLYATTRALEIISEASRRLPDKLKDRYPEMLWKEMRNAGNAYRHDYDKVAATRIWKTAVENLAPLLAIVEAELAATDRDMNSSEGKDPP